MFSAYKKFWTRYADFSGRSSRSDYWWVVLCHFLITLPFSFIAVFGFLIPLFSEVYYAGLYDYEPDLSGVTAGAGLAVFIMFLLAIYWVATIVPNLAIAVRRLRDAGFHWAFIFLTVGPSLASFIPVLNILAALVSLPCSIALIVLLCQASKPAQQVKGAPYGQQGFQGQQQPTQNQQFGQAQQPVQNQQFSQPVNQEQPFAQQQAPVQNQEFGQPQQPFGQNQVNQPTQPFAASQAQTQESTQSAFSASVSEPAESVHSVEAHQSQAETAEQALGTASEQITNSESISQ